MTVRGPRVVLRCDAGPQIGAGHLVRCVALAEGFRRRGARPLVVAGPLPPVWSTLVAGRGIELAERATLGPGRAGEDELPPDETGRPVLAVLDGYSFDAHHVDAWRRTTPFVALVADYGPGHGANAVVDHNLSAREDRYPGTALRLLGPEYALLREEFREPPPPRTADDPPVVLVSLGGSATSDLLPRVLDGLEAAGAPLVARVIAGPHDGDEEPPGEGTELRGLAVVQRAAPRPTLRDEIATADLGLLAAGGVRFEAARLGLPMILGVLADNQEDDARAFVDAGAAVSIGRLREATPEGIGRAVRELLGDAEAREAMRATGQRLVDGRGAERAAAALLEAAGEGTAR